ncbi:MAG: hypothetical protein PF637_06950 [Spirochaetes bacterium]|jgi:hypothetical protein|nr:hypothetical protein [Spirochaetota bacterium]
MKINEVSKTTQKKVTSLLSDKPIWAFWLTYIVLSGILFGIFYTTMYFMVWKWWMLAMEILTIGLIWGTLKYKEGNNVEAK